MMMMMIVAVVVTIGSDNADDGCEKTVCNGLPRTL